MLDIGWSELLLTAVVALIVIGPKDLPQAMRTLARLVGRLRAMTREVQSGVAEVMREAELDELRRKMEQAKQFDLGATVQRAVDPDGSLTADFDPEAFSQDLRKTTPAATEYPDSPPEAAPRPAGSPGEADRGQA
jgi:sec-independent protein translocase protein TatB